MINNVSDTAFWIAEYRANETDRPDALFRDPLARRLSGTQGRDIANSMPASRITAWSVVLRTVIIDDFIQKAIAEGVDLILNLGAGLDTRPYRMELPNTLRWIEVDFPHVIEFKESKLADQQPRCNLQRVKLDLGDRERRREFFAHVNSSANRILVLTEGVAPYLSNDDVGALGDDLHATPRVVYWIVDYFSREMLKFRDRASMRAKLKNAPFIFDPPDWFAFFAGHGWKPRQMRYMAEEARRVRRDMPAPWYLKLAFRVRWMTSSPERRKEMMHFAGYALLERT